MSKNLLVFGSSNNNGFNTMEQQDGMNPTSGYNMPDNAASFQQMQMMTNANNNNGMAGYPALLQQYFMQQQQQQQQLLQMQQQAADPGQGDPNLASLMGLMGGGSFYQQQQSIDANRLMLQQLQQQQQQGGMLMPNISDTSMMFSAAPNNNNNNMALGPWSATSASLLGKMGVGGTAGTTMEGVKPKAPRKRKDKNKPKRPLSAYNLFFKEERARILEGIPDPKGEEEDTENSAVKKEDGGAKEEEEQQQQQQGNDQDKASTSKNKESSTGISGSKKRPHGKIGFETLAKTIGERWKNLEASKVEHYKKKAAEDTQRYKREMEAYLGKTSTLQQEKEKKDESIKNEDD